MNERRPTTRRALLATVAVIATGIGTTRAQESTPEAIATPTAMDGLIHPTGVGEVPSTGASRPGPADEVTDMVAREVISPIGLTIEIAGVDAGIEAAGEIGEPRVLDTVRGVGFVLRV